jgi:hypothetical protein
MKIPDEHPIFAHKIAQFITLHDAAQVLEELKPPNGELAIPYLREIANQVMRETGVGEEFVQAMIKARPPIAWTSGN